MMDIKKLGWILSESGLKSIDLSSSTKVINSTLLNKDLREIGAGVSDLHKGKLENIDNELIILQILKLRNISAPKANEQSKTAPKLLKLQLTDGQNTYSAIEMESTALSLEKTPPGTKISLKVKQLKIANGQLLLTPKNMEILGGHVESLVSKWEISRSLANQMKGNRSGGAAPPFIPFGQKIQQNIGNDKGFKSLSSKQKENEENSEFNAQRQDAIAEASKVGTRKTFGGGTKTLVDSNVQKIIDKGYTEEQATTALKFARNNVEKALSNLKRREERQQQRGGSSSNDIDSRENPKDKRNGGNKGSSDMPPAKPSTGVSLFDFLENKIPESTTAKQSSHAHNERFENNISSSFRKYDKDNSNNKSHNQWSQQHQQYSTSSENKSSQNYSSNNNKNSSYNNARNDYESSSREYRDYKDYKGGNSNYRDRNDSKQQQHGNNYQKQGNYSSKSNAASSSASHYSKNSMTTASSSNHHQKPSHSHSSASNNNATSYNSNNNNNNNNVRQGKYGQKSVENNNVRSSNQSKDYSNSYNNNGSSYHHSKARTNNDGYHNSNKSQGNIVESMEKMNLKNNQQHYKGYEHHANTTPPSNYPQIVGFQNKEANEKAKTALKTKTIPIPSQQPPPPPPNNWQQPQQSIPPPPFPNAIVQSQASHQIHAMPPPQSFVQHPTAVMAMPAFQPITYQAAPPIIMQSVPTHMPQPAPPGGIHQLKINDLCLAKYWEDGKFYNAKITGVSDSTYVVLFTEYGNAEEVRKTDCVPLVVPTCPTPPNFHAVPAPPPSSHMGGGGTYHVSSSQKMPPQQSQQQPPPQHGYHGQQQAAMPYKGGVKRRN